MRFVKLRRFTDGDLDLKTGLMEIMTLGSPLRFQCEGLKYVIFGNNMEVAAIIL
jgi:hypothetical protein